MSHILVLAILPKEATMEQAEDATALLLQPFDEGTSVEPYETGCWCIGVAARTEVEERINTLHDINALRARYESLPKGEQTDARWAELVAPRKVLREKLLREHPLADKPNPGCQSCNGTGTRVTRYNPQSKWDWWVIGGRWDGWIYGPEREMACGDGMGGFNFGDEHRQVKNNCRPVSEITADDPHYVPFAILTPESEWIEQGKMGWWAIVSDAMEDVKWHETVKAVLARYQGHLAVAVDCHI